MGASPVLAPHGRPAPPAPAARRSHYQSQPLVHSRRDARAAAHLTSTTSPFCALCRLCTLLLASHKRLYQDAPRVRRRFRTTQGTHARTHPHARARALIRSGVQHRLPACLHTQHTAPWARTALNDAARTPQQQPAPRLITTSRAHSASSPTRDTAARASARLQSL